MRNQNIKTHKTTFSLKQIKYRTKERNTYKIKTRNTKKNKQKITIIIKQNIKTHRQHKTKTQN